MPDLETPDGDAAEQQQTAGGPVGLGEDGGEVSMEAPEADAVEQHTPVRDAGSSSLPDDHTWEADDGDLAESAREVPLDDDDYR